MDFHDGHKVPHNYQQTTVQVKAINAGTRNAVILNGCIYASD